jgi:hypothetical protein
MNVTKWWKTDWWNYIENVEQVEKPRSKKAKMIVYNGLLEMIQFN